MTAMYDEESRGNRLLERARLTLQDQRLILVGSRYSLAFDDIMDSMVMQFPDFRGPPPVVGLDGQPVRPKGASKGSSSSTSASTTSIVGGKNGHPSSGKAAARKSGTPTTWTRPRATLTTSQKRMTTRRAKTATRTRRETLPTTMRATTG